MNLDIYRRILAGESLTFSLNPRALWRLTGPDRIRYLNGQVTNGDVSRKYLPMGNKLLRRRLHGQGSHGRRCSYHRA